MSYHTDLVYLWLKENYPSATIHRKGFSGDEYLTISHGVDDQVEIDINRDGLDWFFLHALDKGPTYQVHISDPNYFLLLKKMLDSVCSTFTGHENPASLRCNLGHSRRSCPGLTNEAIACPTPLDIF